MATVSDTERGQRFMHVLGDELRTARKLRGWTRKDLVARLPCPISLQTVATYELGTRSCSVARFLDLVDALEVSAVDIWARALERISDVEHVPGMHVDLVVAARIRRAELAPLRRWAHVRLDTLPEGQSTVVRLSLPALEWLAELCGVSTVDLIRTVRSLSKVESAPTVPEVPGRSSLQ